MNVLAVDVGGTKTLFAQIRFAGGRAEISEERRYPSSGAAGLREHVERYVDECDPRVDGVGLGLAGPIVDGTCHLPKLGWTVDEGDVAPVLPGVPVRLVNDFTAVGLGIDWIGEEDRRTLHEGRLDVQGPRALIGAGTGLGEGYALWLDGRWRVFPSEGGNADFAPRGELLCSYLLHERERIGRSVTYDDVLSGRGLASLYRFLVDGAGREASAGVEAEMRAPDADPAAVVSEHGLARTDPVCEEALDLFCEVYGAESGNQAVRYVATGGVWIAGGITPRIVERLDSARFREAFEDKGMMRPFAERVPAIAILEPRVGLVGAGAAALEPDPQAP